MIQQDKVLHFAVGAVIGAVGALAVDALFGAALAAFAGVAKEVFDAYHPRHQADVWDVVWTVVGGVAGVVPVALIA